MTRRYHPPTAEDLAVVACYVASIIVRRWIDRGVSSWDIDPRGNPFGRRGTRGMPMHLAATALANALADGATYTTTAAGLPVPLQGE